MNPGSDQSFLDAFLDPQHRRIDRGERGRAVLDRQIGEVDVHRKSRQVTHEQIDRCSAFQREDILLRDVRHNTQKKSDLSPVAVEKRHTAILPPGRRAR